MVTKVVRVRYLGWRDPRRVRTSRGRCHGRGALVFQWIRQHGMRPMNTAWRLETGGFEVVEIRRESGPSGSGVILPAG
jgi:hypothetical protein